MIDNVDSSVKIIVVGNGGVGKTSMLRRFCKGEFTNDYKKTVGTDFLEKNVFLKATDQIVNLMLWDTAGQEIFDALTASYYRGAGGCVLAFSTVDRDSFMAVERWKGKVEAQCGKNSVVMVLVQTKCDLDQTASITEEEGVALAKKLGIAFFRTSTKNNINVASVFEYIAEKCVTSGTTGDIGRDIATAANGGGAATTTSSGTTAGGASPMKTPGKPTEGFAQQNEDGVAAGGKITIQPKVTRAKKKKMKCTIL
eukprot:PhM_4_TR8873/c0_g1_i1/m.40835/K06234/RAB23; Ras-related protein Rab-23